MFAFSRILSLQVTTTLLLTRGRLESVGLFEAGAKEIGVLINVNDCPKFRMCHVLVNAAVTTVCRGNLGSRSQLSSHVPAGN